MLFATLQGRCQVFRARGVQVDWLSIHRCYPHPFPPPFHQSKTARIYANLMGHFVRGWGFTPLDPPQAAAPDTLYISCNQQRRGLNE